MRNEKTAAKVISVYVSKPKTVVFGGRLVNTAIFKEPVQGPVSLGKLNLDGDEQADLSVHGGPDKAVYAYPSEHYEWWRRQMPDCEFAYGKFGENLNTVGILETDVFIGDEFQVGTAIIKVSQPRLPCYKLGVKFGRNDVIKTFMQSGYSGVYFSVSKEGVLSAGSDIKFLRGDNFSIKVSDVANLFTGRRSRDPDFIERCLNSQLADQMKMFISSI
jgi:MOSC domain-containing protein YiiM